MDDNSQILDVTYGNFSCRLEGFEDSVETMKLVVSFFHDLAGHDRFMDTGPLAPDMDTLARLTEEQTGQAVDIEATQEKVSLRVRPTLDEDEEETASEEAAGDEEAAPFDSAPVPSMETEAPAHAHDDENEEARDLSGVADKLKRMRAAAQRKMAATSDEYAEDLSEPAPVPAANPLSQRLSELAKRTVEAEQDAAVEDEPAPETSAHEEEPANADTSDVVEPETAANEEPLEADDLNVFSNLAEEISGPVAQTPTDADDTTADDGAEDTYGAYYDNFADASPAMVDTDAETDEAEEEDAIAAQTVSADEDISEGQIAADEMHDEDDASVDTELDAFLAEEDAEIAPDTQQPDAAVAEESEEEAEVQEPVAEATDTDDEDNDALSDEEAPLVLTSDDVAQDDHDDYNDDDEFDLEKEVAKVEAEIAARKGNEFARRGLPRHVEDAMSRIMSQTDQHLNQPENRRHRDAFAQLKAAVAATEAARQLGDRGAEKRDPDEAYKDDLGAHEAMDKGEGKSAPPLKLVKSQEVRPETDDADNADDSDVASTPAAALEDQADATSARLRQIATQKEAEVAEENGSFAEFAATHGVTDLADQLEAAGAYICLVEGESDFSRPQVMKVVQAASNSEISREDGLRSFGRLLRQARLIKLANGRFQVAENTQFRPDGNRAAQG